MSYLDNGVIRLGVDLGKGGTITYLASSGPPRVNVINSFDLGREVQQSYYAGPDNFGSPAPPWTNFPWNPIGAGDTYGHPAPVLAQTNDGLTIYTKTAPLQWALSHVPCECLIEQWITLNGNSVRVRNRLTNNRSDRTKYEAYGQELPAAYTNGTFWRLLTYSGNSPYTNGPLTEIVNAGPPWAQFSATEHWAALVDDSGFGLGVFNAFVTNYIGGFAGTPDIGGPSDDPTGYIAPSIPEILDWNIVYEYDYALVVGTVDQIRAYAVAHRPDSRPDYQFARDRQHFNGFINATDNGFPISGALHINLDQDDPYIIGPEQWWQASDMPRLYVTAAYHTSGTNAEVFWSIPGQSFSGERHVRFTAIPDGQYHTYTVDLASSPAYQGTITGLRFDPSDGNDPGGYVDIASITWKSPEMISAENYQGLWSNAPAGSESGWGINFAHSGDQVFATWFTYDANGKAWWLSMLASKTTAGTYSGSISIDSGPPFNNFVGSGTPMKVGTGTLTFSDANTGTFTYYLNAGVGGSAMPVSQIKTIARYDLFTGPQVTCTFDPTANLALATNYQDLWWAASGAESGWGTNFAHQGDSIFLTWYTYDVDIASSPLWLSALTQRVGTSNVYTGPLLRTSGPRFDNYKAGDVVQPIPTVGTATLTFANGNSAMFSYQTYGNDGLPALSQPQIKSIVRFPFGPGGTVCK